MNENNAQTKALEEEKRKNEAAVKDITESYNAAKEKLKLAVRMLNESLVLFEICANKLKFSNIDKYTANKLKIKKFCGDIHGFMTGMNGMIRMSDRFQSVVFDEIKDSLNKGK